MESGSNIDDLQVIEYLRANPDFFQTYSSELSDLKVGHASGGAISLIERQVEVLRERIFRMRRRMNQLLHTARNNDELFAKVRSLTLALLDVSTWQDLNEVLATNMLVEFDADYVCCHVQGDRIDFDHIRSYESAAPFEPFLNGTLPVCATLRPAELQALFPVQGHRRDGSIVPLPLTPSQGNGSAVLLPLALSRGDGCLAVGSRETHRFTRDLDTFFVSHIGDMLSRIVNHLKQPGSAQAHSSRESLQPGSARGCPSQEESPQPGSARGCPSQEESPQPENVRGRPSGKQ